MAISMDELKGKEAYSGGFKADFGDVIADTKEEENDLKVLEAGCKACKIEDGKFVCNGTEDNITCFWATNITSKKELFDFDNAKWWIGEEVENKLVGHGLLGWERYADYIEMIYGEEPTIERLAIKTDIGRVYIDENELRNTLYKHISNRLEEGYEDVPEFQELKEVHEKLENWENLSEEEKSLIFDKAIHAYHLTGPVMGVDVEQLREDFEEEVEI